MYMAIFVIVLYVFDFWFLEGGLLQDVVYFGLIGCLKCGKVWLNFSFGDGLIYGIWGEEFIGVDEKIIQCCLYFLVVFSCIVVQVDYLFRVVLQVVGDFFQ